MTLKDGKSSSLELWDYGNTGPSPIKSTYNVTTLASLIDSRGHNVELLGKSNIGGPWRLMKHWRQVQTLELEPYYNSTLKRWYGGKFTGSPRWLTTPNSAVAGSTITDLESQARDKSAHAINATNPVKPEAETMTAILDTIKDGLPGFVGHTFWREGTTLAKNAGDEYLNVEFGWLPLIRDIQDFCKTVMSANSILANYERGAGQRTRRRFDVLGNPGTITSTTTQNLNTYPAMGQIFLNGRREDWTLDTNQIWFEGAFRYYLPESGLARFSRLASRLFGTAIGPSQLWNLAPWSWAADWFGNVGDVLANIQYLGSDACVLEWGYMMHHQMQQRISSHTLVGRTAGHPQISPGQPYNFAVVDTIEYKTRIVASPYSFALTPAPLTQKQGAIITALGLSKLGNWIKFF